MCLVGRGAFFSFRAQPLLVHWNSRRRLVCSGNRSYYWLASYVGAVRVWRVNVSRVAECRYLWCRVSGIMHGAFRTHVGVVPNVIALDYFHVGWNNNQTTLRPRQTNRQTKTERLHHRASISSIRPDEPPGSANGFTAVVKVSTGWLSRLARHRPASSPGPATIDVPKLVIPSSRTQCPCVW